MLKLSIFATRIRLLQSYFPFITNHHENLSCFMQLYKRMTAQVLDFNIKIIQKGIKLLSLVVLTPYQV